MSDVLPKHKIKAWLKKYTAIPPEQRHISLAKLFEPCRMNLRNYYYYRDKNFEYMTEYAQREFSKAIKKAGPVRQVEPEEKIVLPQTARPTKECVIKFCKSLRSLAWEDAKLLGINQTRFGIVKNGGILRFRIDVYKRLYQEVTGETFKYEEAEGPDGQIRSYSGG